MTELPPDHEKRFGGTIRLAREGDGASLRSILETWIRDPDTKQVIDDEIEEVLEAVKQSAKNQGEATYFVAETLQGEVIGMMGFRPPEEKMKPYVTTSKPAELISAYVAQNHRGGRGVGHALVNTVRQRAKEKGYTEIILNSGPRYKFSGWPIWMRLFGKPVAVAKEYYGEGGDAPIWREILEG